MTTMTSRRTWVTRAREGLQEVCLKERRDREGKERNRSGSGSNPGGSSSNNKNVHNRNPADAMTKLKCAHMEPLLNLLRSGMYTMRGEREELETRANQKKSGTVPRNKVSANRFNQQSSPPKQADKA